MSWNRTPLNQTPKITIRLKSLFIDFNDFKTYMGENNNDIRQEDYDYIFTIYGNKNIKFNNNIRARLYFKTYYLSYLEVYKKEMEIYNLSPLSYLDLKEQTSLKNYITDNSDESENDFEIYDNFLSDKSLNERISKDMLINHIEKINEILKNRRDPILNFYSNIVSVMESTYQAKDYNRIGDRIIW